MARRRRPRHRKLQAAKMVLIDGKTPKEAAEALGVTASAVRQNVAAVLDYSEHEDILKCRALVNARLDLYRKPLLEIAGIANVEAGQEKADTKKVGEAPSRVSAVRALNEIEKRRCEMFGWDAPKLVYTPPPPAGSLKDASLEEIADECKRSNIPIPPGVRDELARRAAAAQGAARDTAAH